MGYTVAEAVTRLRSEYLDAPTSVRWSETALKQALRVAAMSCSQEAIGKDSRLFRRRTTDTATTAGALALTSYKPVRIHAVEHVTGLGRRELPGTSNGMAGGVAVDGTLGVVYSRLPEWSDTETQPLVRLSDGTALVDDNQLDEWIVARAALVCLAKEPNPRRKGAEEVEGMMRAAVCTAPRIPSSGIMPPLKRSHFGQWPLTWSWNESTKTINLVHQV